MNLLSLTVRLAEEGGAATAPVVAPDTGAGGVFDLLWLVIALPLLGAFLLLGVAPFLQGSLKAAADKHGHLVGTAMSALSFVLSLVLFLEDGEPVGLPALVPWAPGAAVGATANLLFLVVVVLAGPLAALLAARRAPGRAASVTRSGRSGLRRSTMARPMSEVPPRRRTERGFPRASITGLDLSNAAWMLPVEATGPLPIVARR